MTAEARSVVVRLTAETAQYIASMQAAGTMTEGAMVKAEAATMKQSQALDHLGGVAGKAGLVAAAGLGAMAMAAVSWESDFRGVQKTVNGTASEMAGLEDELRGLARTMPATHQEIAATAEAAGQLGVARKDITEFTKVMVELGSSTNLSADEAATSIAQFMNVMQTVPDQVDEIANTLVALGNAGASTESQIMEMAQRLAGAGQLVGASESDILGMASAMANLGIQSELGGGAIQRTFLVIYQAVKNGGDQLDGFARLAGMSAKEFADAWANDPIRTFDALVKGMGGVQASGGNLIQTLDDLGIKGTQNLQVILRLAGAGDMLSTSLDQSAAAWDKNNALYQEFAQRLGTTASQVKIAWNNIKDAGIEAGQELLPVISETASTVASLARAFGDLPAPVHGALVQMLEIAAVLGGGMWFTAKVINGVTQTSQALDTLAGSGTRASKAIAGLKTAGAIAAGVMILGDAVEQVSMSFDKSVPGVEALTKNLLDMGSSSALDAIAGDLGNLHDSIETLNDPSLLANISDLYNAVPLGGGKLGAMLPGVEAAGQQAREAAASVKVLDDALAGIVTTGSPEAAAEVFNKLAAAYDLTAEEQSTLRDLLPSYQAALDQSSNSAKLSAAATGEATSATQQMAPAAFDLADALLAEAKANREAVAAMRDKTAATNSAFDAETQWGQAVMAAKDAAAKGKRGINELTAAGQENRSALSQLAAAWNNQSGAVQNADGKFHAARKTFIDTATAMGVPQKAAEKLARTMLEMPSQKVIEVRAKTEAAQAALEKIQNFKLLDKYVTVHTLHTDSGGVDYQHGGGTTPATSTPKTVVPQPSGRTTTAGSVTRSLSQAPAARALTPADTYAKTTETLATTVMKAAGSVDKLAGSAESAAYSIHAQEMGIHAEQVWGLQALKVRQKLLEKEVERDKAEVDREKQRLDLFKQERQSIIDAIAGRFTGWDSTDTTTGNGNLNHIGPEASVDANGNPVGWTQDQWDAWQAQFDASQTMTPQQQLDQQLAQNQLLLDLLNQLSGLGLSGDALTFAGENLTLAQMQQLLSSGQAGVSQFQQTYGQVQDTAQAAGTLVGDKVWGQKIDHQTKVLEDTRDIWKRAEDHLEQVQHILARMEKLAEKNPKDTGQHAGKALAQSLDNHAGLRSRKG